MPRASACPSSAPQGGRPTGRRRPERLARRSRLRETRPSSAPFDSRHRASSARTLNRHFVVSNDPPFAIRSAHAAFLPTTMVGSYPRPAWFDYQLEGRDVLEAFKLILASHAEAFEDARRTCLHPGPGASGARHRHRRADVVRRLRDGDRLFPLVLAREDRRLRQGEARAPGPFAKAKGTDAFALDEAGGVAVRGPIARGPVRLAELFRHRPEEHAPAREGVRGRGSRPALDPRALPIRPSAGSLRAVARARGRLSSRDRRPRERRVQARPARGSRRLDPQLEWRKGLRVGERDRQPHARGVRPPVARLALLPRKRLGQPHDRHDRRWLRAHPASILRRARRRVRARLRLPRHGGRRRPS